MILNADTPTPSTRQRAAVHAALGDPHRLAIVDALRLSDRTPSDFAAALGLPSNLFAHHVDTLERAGVVRRAASDGDKRRRYLQLVPEALAALSQTVTLSAGKVLFVCTENAARSQLAAARLRALGVVQTGSAGTRPANAVHPLAIRVGAAHGLDIASARPRHVDAVDFAPDLVITVCDRANEAHPFQSAMRLHWSIPDPAQTNTRDAFEQAYLAIERRVIALAASLVPSSPAPHKGAS